MRRTETTNGQRSELNAFELWLFHQHFRGKLRIAEKYSDAIGLRRRPFRGMVRLPIGDYWVDTNHRLDWAMLFGGMEQETIRWLLGQFPSVRGAWDVGGHHGEYSLPLARSLAPGFKVHVFEPFPESAEIVLRNVSANNLEHEAFVHQQAVGPAVGSAKLLLSANGSQNHSLRSWVGTSSASTTVPVTTLDTALGAYGVPEFVKIDIEGGELGAFEGGTALLAERTTTFLFESELWSDDRSVLHGFLRDHGYTLRGLRRGMEVPGVAERMIVARPTHQRVG